MRITPFLLVGVLCLGNYSAAQIRVCHPEPHTLPDDLQSTLQTRLAKFLTMEAQGQWDDVAQLLGNRTFFRESSYKQCLVSRMQELRMVRFDLSSPDLYTCTTQTDLPSGAVDRVTAEQLLWFVRGTATFQTTSETWLEETQIRAYRDQGQWYFVPPQQGMQPKWEKIHYTEADFTRDRRDEIEVPNPPSAPIEITDVHVYMDRQHPSDRDIKFKLRNKTSKKVVALSVTIGDKSGFAGMSGPYELEAKGQISLEQTVAAYGDFCRGPFKDAMVVTDVSFADGSKWQFKEPAGGERTNER
jgi:hypothetical protein